MDLVEQLLLDGSRRHRAARTCDLGDDEFAVLADLADRKAEPGEIGDVLYAGIGEIAAGDLARAFEQVADQRAAAEHRPVVHRPAEFGDQRRHEDRRVRRAAGDHDVRAALQRLDDRGDADIGVGGNDAVAHRGDRLAVVERHVVVVKVGEDVVAGDGGDLEPLEPELAGDCARRLGRGGGVGGAHVGDDLHLVPGADGQDRPHARREQRIVAGVRVLHLDLLRERDRPLGEAFEHEVVETALFGELHGGLDPVSRIACAGTDPDGLHRFTPLTDGNMPSTTQAIVMTIEAPNRNGIVNR